MRNPQGYAYTADPDRGLVERDTFTCNHCQFVVFVRPASDPTDMGGFCRMCMKHICAKCADEGVCLPFEKKLDQYERANRFHQAVGTVLRAFVFFLLMATPIYAAELALAWTDASSTEDSFEIYRSTSYGGTYSLVTTTAANVTSYLDTGLTPNQEYCYKIRSCLTGTCSDYIGPICTVARSLPGSSEFQ